MTPIGWSGVLFSSAGRYPRPRPIVMYISSLVFFSSVAMCASGLRISTPEGRSMSLAVISPGPVATSGASTSVASECIRQTMPLRFRTMSVTSSVTPLDRRELVRDALDAHARDGSAREGGEQHSPQRVAERVAETAIEGLDGERAARGVIDGF